MAETVANVILDARIAMPDLADDTSCLRWLNVVHRDLVEEFRLATTSADLTLTTTDREYSLNENYVSVWSAEYRSSATATPIAIYETSVDELDTDYAAWRNNFKGQPQWYYQYVDNNGAAVLGFDRLPSVATSGSYPTVRYYVSVYTALTANGNIPASVRDSQVYVWGLCYEFAKKRHRDDLAAFEKLYTDAKNELGVYVGRRQRRNEPRILPYLRMGSGAR